MTESIIFVLFFLNKFKSCEINLVQDFIRRTKMLVVKTPPAENVVVRQILPPWIPRTVAVLPALSRPTITKVTFLLGRKRRKEVNGVM